LAKAKPELPPNLSKTEQDLLWRYCGERGWGSKSYGLASDRKSPQITISCGLRVFCVQTTFMVRMRVLGLRVEEFRMILRQVF
jgi:hypothetical protein